MISLEKKRALTVQETVISIHKIEGEDYICLTDMVRGEEGADHIKNWMRNRNTIEFNRFRKKAGL